MNKVEKIKAEIERRYNILKHVASPENKDYYDGKIEAYIETLDFLNSLKEPVSNDLEDFAKKESESFAEREYEIDYIDRSALAKGYYWGVKAGAQWQKKHLEENRIKHCDNITEEQYNLESEFVDDFIDKHDRLPTFLDAIEYGINYKKE